MFKRIVAALAIATFTTIAVPAEPTQQTQERPIRFKVPPKLMLPLMINKGENAVLLALTYEYCSGVPFGSNIVAYIGHRQAVIDVAKVLTEVLSKADFPEEAAFYAICSLEKGR